MAKTDSIELVGQSASQHVSKFKKIFDYLNSFGNNFRYLVRASKVDYAFLGAFSFRVRYKNSWINRFFDPVIEELERKGCFCARLEHKSSGTDLQGFPIYQYSKIFFVEELIRTFRVYQKVLSLLRIEEKSNLTRYEAFIGELIQIPEFTGIEDSLAIPSLERDFRVIAAYRSLFQLYLKLLRPKVLFVLCYYSPAVHAAIAAARSIDIPTVDLQHGPQTGVHPAYSRFRRVPVSGFNILPNIFWVWDQVSEKGLKEWIDQQEYHQVYQWGHPWIEYWIKRGMESNKNKNDRPTILYSLQPIGDLLEEYVVSAMQESWQDYLWCLRLHPRQQHEYDSLNRILEKFDLLNKVVVDDGLNSPLPEVLVNTQVHLTRFSGTAIEAAMFSVPTIFLDSLANDIFVELIKSNLASLLPRFTKNALLEEIDRVVRVSVLDKQGIHTFLHDYNGIFKKKFQN
ncbi:MAG: hypothetical protein ACFB15_10160 [Cyclobacteriaceae bacterium]